jgi:hypothetical protein
VELERIISSDAAVRGMLESFELGQIWITDPKLGDLEKEQRKRMKREFGRNAIPLHVIVHPDTGKELGRIEYHPTISAKDYLKFLEEGLAAFQAGG